MAYLLEMLYTNIKKLEINQSDGGALNKAQHSAGESRAPHTLSLTDMKSAWHDDTYKIIKRHTKPTTSFVRSTKEGQTVAL